VLTGVYQRDAGTLMLAGQTINPRNTAEAQRLGIGTVYQEVNLLPNMSVADNLFIGREPKRFGLIDRKTLNQRAIKLLADYGFELDVTRPLGQYSVAMQQIIAICRAVDLSAKVLILDEPTAGVDIELRRSMWTFLQELNAQGTTIILTTHYLEEAEMLCRNIGIIQRGELVENTSMKGLLSKLKSETFILDLAPKSPLPKLEGFQYRLADTSTLEVEVLREQGLNSVFSQLSHQGVQVLSMRNKANRLEELFVDLVNGRNGDKA
jgi:ABC-type sugar transport system ATPase subunit